MSKDKVVPPASELCGFCGQPRVVHIFPGGFPPAGCTSYVPPAPMPAPSMFGPAAAKAYEKPATPPQAAPRIPCDGNHAMPPCNDPQCWHGEPPQAAPSLGYPKTPWEDSRVQKVYNILCADDDQLADKPEEEHWEGFLARLIVDALSSSEAEIPPATPGQAREAIAWRSGYEARKREVAASRDEAVAAYEAKYGATR